MITVDVYRAEDGSIRGFRAKGHAGYAEHGADIVCAAVSAITQTAALGLLEHLKTPVKLKQAPGLLECWLSSSERASGGAQAVLETMLLGLAEVQRQHPERIRLRRVSVRGGAPKAGALASDRA